MELFISLGLLLLGIVKRIYWLLPAIFLDPIDLLERCFGMTFEVPQWLAWVLVLIGFAIAITLTYHELRQKSIEVNKQLETILNAKPSIVVIPQDDGCLLVENNGGEGRFRARAQMVYDKHLEGSDWFIKWAKSTEIEQAIFKGESSVLEVASCEWDIVYRNGNPRRKGPFFRFPRAERVLSMEGKQEMYVSDRDLSPRDPNVEIEVRIFSSPEMRSPFKQRYLLKLAPEEDTVSIEEVSTETK